MKIKCPACSKVLGIPESAAGKVVKCPCGKQLKAPGGATGKPAAKPAAAKAAPAKPAAARKTPARPTPQRPVARPPAKPAAAPASIDPGIFDELTDGDLSGVRAVTQPGVKQSKKPKANKDPLAKYGSEVEQEEVDQKKEVREGASREIRTSIGILLTLGLIRFAVGLFFVFSAGHDAEAILGPEAGEEEIATLTLIFQIVHGVNVTIGALFLGCAGLIFMFPMTCAITAMATFIIAEIFGLLFNPFNLLNIRGWIFRIVIFGGLIQTINNASYYKFVKSGGRDKK